MQLSSLRAPKLWKQFTQRCSCTNGIIGIDIYPARFDWSCAIWALIAERGPCAAYFAETQPLQFIDNRVFVLLPPVNRAKWDGQLKSVIDIRHWLLDAAVEHSVPLPTLASPQVAEILNRKPHGLPPTEIAAVLAEMCRDGEIILGGDAAVLSDAAAVSGTRIFNLMSHPSRCWYQLTTRGGSQWEVRARPQCSRYTTSCESGNLSAIGAATATFAEELLGLEASLNHQRVIVDRTIRRRTLRNWRATYWKTLPEGHLIAFRTRPLSRSEWSPMPHREWARWVDLRKFYLRPASCGF